jgi:hypothetical protein
LTAPRATRYLLVRVEWEKNPPATADFADPGRLAAHDE